MFHNDRLTDLEAHQVLADYQRSRIGLACRRDQLVDGRRRHVFAGEHDEMRERGEFRPRLRKHPSGFLRRGVVIDDALDIAFD